MPKQDCLLSVDGLIKSQRFVTGFVNIKSQEEDVIMFRRSGSSFQEKQSGGASGKFLLRRRFMFRKNKAKQTLNWLTGSMKVLTRLAEIIENHFKQSCCLSGIKSIKHSHVALWMFHDDFQVLCFTPERALSHLVKSPPTAPKWTS